MHIFLVNALANLLVFQEFHLISFWSWTSKMWRERTCNAKPYSFFWDPQEARKGGGRWQIALEWVEQGRGVGWGPWGHISYWHRLSHIRTHQRQRQKKTWITPIIGEESLTSSHIRNNFNHTHFAFFDRKLQTLYLFFLSSHHDLHH